MARPSFGQDSVGRAALVSPACLHPVDGSQTALHVASTNAELAALDYGTASYDHLGGRFRIPAVGGSLDDYNLFAFPVPVDFRLLICGITISLAVSGAAVVAGALLDWSLGIKARSETLDDLDLIRIPLGVQGLAPLAGIGTTAPDIVRDFEPELVISHGEWAHLILAVPDGFATPNLVYRGDVVIHGYFERS